MEIPTFESKDQAWITFIPVCLLAAAWTLWAVFQMIMLFQESSTLKTLRANQEPTVQQAMKLRAQLDSIAAETAKLAAKGNSGAKTIVGALKQRGITINPNAKRSPEQ